MLNKSLQKLDFKLFNFLSSRKVLDITIDNIDPEVVRVCEKLSDAGYLNFYLTGTCSTYLLLGLKPPAYEIVIWASGLMLLKLFPDLVINKNKTRVATLSLKNTTLTFLPIRKDSISNKQDSLNQYFEDLRAMAESKKFSFQSIYYNPIKKQVICHGDGFQDIRKQIITVTNNDYSNLFDKNPIAILQTLRFAKIFDFELNEKTASYINDNGENLLASADKISVYIELEKIIASDKVGLILKEIWQKNLLKSLFSVNHNRNIEYGNNLIFNTFDAIQKQELPDSKSRIIIIFSMLCWPILKEEINKQRTRNYPNWKIRLLAFNKVMARITSKIALPNNVITNIKEAFLMQFELQKPKFSKLEAMLIHKSFKTES